GQSCFQLTSCFFSHLLSLSSRKIITVASNLGLVSFSDPSLAAAGYQTEQFNHMRRLNAPLAKPLPCLASEQPVVVVFPGGCTYGEVAALRFVASRRRWHLLIATSALLTSRDLLQQAGQAACHPGGTDRLSANE
ncbi:putative vacuolar protein sorting (Vps33), partial [Fasciolopsis buskii]